MAPPSYREGFSEIGPRTQIARRHADVARRLAWLEQMAADPVRIARLIADGRHLRLCAAIAWASAAVDRECARLEAVAPGAPVLLH